MFRVTFPTWRSNVFRYSLAAVALSAATLSAQAPRPLTFLDAQNMKQAAGSEISPDGRTMLYTLSVPDWNAQRRQSDIYLVSLDRGLSSTRQLTFTKDKNETSPRWSSDGSFVAFVSNRESTGTGAAANRNQLFVMRLDGGEAKRVTD